MIDGYLARLGAAAADLPLDAREELINDVRSHIAEARGRETEETDATVLNILDRLGDPAVVVAEARDRFGERTPTNLPSSIVRSGLVEIAAIVLLPTFWLIGVILLWWSPAWKTRDKIIGTIGSLGGYGTVFLLGAMLSYSPSIGGGSCTGSAYSDLVISQNCSTTPFIQVVGGISRALVGVVFILLPLLTSIYLALRLRGRRKREMAVA